MRVRDVMHTDYCHIDGLATVADALALLRRRGAQALVVDKRDADDEYGIVLLSDIATQVLARARAPERVNLYEIMSKPALSVPPDMRVHHCARLFERFGLQQAPVIDGHGQVLGMVGYVDLVLKGM